MYCDDFSILGDGPAPDQILTIQDSPFWTVHPYASSNIHIQYLNISNDPGRDAHGGRIAPNTDGIDPDSCTDVVIQDCVLTTGDDGVAVKSGFNQAGITFNRPTANVTVRNVSVTTGCCNGFCIGSETSGGVRDILFENVTATGGTGSAFTVKTAAGRGAYVRNVTFQDALIGSAGNGLTVNEHYGGSCVEPACN